MYDYPGISSIYKHEFVVEDETEFKKWKRGKKKKNRTFTLVDNSSYEIDGPSTMLLSICKILSVNTKKNTAIFE